MNKINLRTTFNNIAQLYEAVRPRYPEKIFDLIIKKTQLPRKAKLLEIGPGTGQATEPFARRGYNITAIELGNNLAEVARRKLVKYKNVKIINSSFEEAKLRPKTFDLIYAATAFHWIKPDVKFIKPHKILKDNGYLVIIRTNHVSDESGDKFFWDTQPIYRKYEYEYKSDKFHLKNIDQLEADEIDEKLFMPVFFGKIPQVESYSAKKYIQLLNTYSSVLSMKIDHRKKFLKEIGTLIEEKFGGNIKKHFVMTLTVAEKRVTD